MTKVYKNVSLNTELLKKKIVDAFEAGINITEATKLGWVYLDHWYCIQTDDGRDVVNVGVVVDLEIVDDDGELIVAKEL